MDCTNKVTDLKEQENIILKYESLLNTVTHDLKNRISSVSMCIQMMSDTDLQDKDEIKFYQNTLENEVDKINLIIGEILNVRDEQHKNKTLKNF